MGPKHILNTIWSQTAPCWRHRVRFKLFMALKSTWSVWFGARATAQSSLGEYLSISSVCCTAVGPSQPSPPTPAFALLLWGKAMAEWRQQMQPPSVGAASEEQPHFKWNVRFSRHSHKFFICNWLWGRRPASDNKPWLSETKGWRGKGTRNETLQKSFVYSRWTNAVNKVSVLLM